VGWGGAVSGSARGASAIRSIGGEPAGAGAVRAAARTIDRSTRRRRRATALIRTRAQSVLITRGTLDDRRYTTHRAPASKTWRRPTAPAPRGPAYTHPAG